MMQTVLLVVFILFLQACESRAERFTVVKVQDGDSLIVEDVAGQQHKVRLSGIDAPEYGQPYGEESRQKLTTILLNKPVRLEVIKTDPYGRLVAKVWVQPRDCSSRDEELCGKTLDAGMAQLTTGMAWWYRYWAKEQPKEDRHRYEFAEREAKARKAGLWKGKNPVNPREWRKKNPRR